MEYRSNSSKKRKKKVRKNSIIFIESLAIVALSVALIFVSVNYVGLKNSIKDNDNLTSGSSSVTNSDSSSQAQYDETKEWYLKLVNPDLSVTNEFISSVKLANIDSRFVSGTESSKFLDERYNSLAAYVPGEQPQDKKYIKNI